MYKTKIVEVGELVPEFKEEQLLVTFGANSVTPELKDISAIHEIQEDSKNPLYEGGRLTIADQQYKINKVGSEANANLGKLGHVSIYFRNDEEVLPGAILVEEKEFPEFVVGDTITFE